MVKRLLHCLNQVKETNEDSFCGLNQVGNEIKDTFNCLSQVEYMECFIRYVVETFH